jgi:hypothetical protein
MHPGKIREPKRSRASVQGVFDAQIDSRAAWQREQQSVQRRGEVVECLHLAEHGAGLKLSVAYVSIVPTSFAGYGPRSFGRFGHRNLRVSALAARPSVGSFCAPPFPGAGRSGCGLEALGHHRNDGLNMDHRRQMANVRSAGTGLMVRPLRSGTGISTSFTGAAFLRDRQRCGQPRWAGAGLDSEPNQAEPDRRINLEEVVTPVLPRAKNSLSRR